MEFAWIALLAVAYLDRRVRPLADLLVVKWVLSYVGILFLTDWMPMMTDAAIGVVCLAATRLTLRREIVGGIIIASMLVHAAYWTSWEHGIWWPGTYKVLENGLYTLAVLTLMPWERVRAWGHRLSQRLVVDRDVSREPGVNRNSSPCVTD